MNKQTQDSFEMPDLELSTKESSSSVLQPRLYSKELFSIAREVIIEHAGEEYRLRLTRQGKLILTK